MRGWAWSVAPVRVPAGVCQAEAGLEALRVVRVKVPLGSGWARCSWEPGPGSGPRASALSHLSFVAWQD